MTLALILITGITFAVIAIQWARWRPIEEDRFLHFRCPGCRQKIRYLASKAGSVAGFAYSPANKNSGATWGEQTLDTYLIDPRKFIPGTKMVFAGLKNPEDRKALIEYLKEQH